MESPTGAVDSAFQTVHELGSGKEGLLVQSWTTM